MSHRCWHGGAAYRAALEVRSPGVEPAEWAETQCSLANTLVTLGKRSGDHAHFQAAIEAYECMSEFYSMNGNAAESMEMQEKLGDTHWNLAKVTGSDFHQRAAAFAYQEALAFHMGSGMPSALTTGTYPQTKHVLRLVEKLNGATGSSSHLWSLLRQQSDVICRC